MLLILEHSLSNEVENWREEFYTLNPDAIQDEVEVKKKTYTNDLFGVVLPALDRRNKKFYSTLNEEQRKDISIWKLTRWMSHVNRDTEFNICNVNNLANLNSKFLTKHVELQWMLLAMAGLGKPTKHEWVAAPKGIKKNKLEEALLNHFPLLRTQELELLLKINSKADLELFFKENGYDDKTIKELFKGDAKGK